MEIYNIDYIEWDSSGQFVIGTKVDDVKGSLFVSNDCCITIIKDKKGTIYAIIE